MPIIGWMKKHSIFQKSLKIMSLFVIVFSIPSGVLSTKNSPVPLSHAINSDFDELAPVFSMDGKILYFCREGHPNNKGIQKLADDQDIWVSYRTRNGWSHPVHISGVFNSPTYDFPIGSSADGSVLYIGNEYRKDGNIAPGISKVVKEKNGWSWPRPMKIRNYYNYSNLVNYYLSGDEKVLILNLERSDSYGKMDVYVSFLEKSGDWSEPLNLGRSINSSVQEVTPFLAKDMKTLYFASNRNGGFGGYDMYVSRRIDDSWQNWTEPENMGSKINTSGNDINYVIAPDGKYAVYSSDIRGNKDLYQIKVPERFRPNSVPIVTGSLKDSSGNSVTGVVFFTDKNKKRYRIQTDERGKYTWIAPSTGEYTGQAAKDGFFPVSRKFRLNSSQKINADFTLRPLKEKATLVLNNIFFDYNSDTIKPESYDELNSLTQVMIENPRMIIEISGHTDSTGSREYNIELSKRRALAVKKYLTRKNIASSRVNIAGYGDSRPIASNSTEKGRSMNRRVEFTVMKNS